MTTIKYPSANNIEISFEIRKKKRFLIWKIVDLNLYEQIDKYRKHSDIYQIAYKVIIVDKLYNCYFKKNPYEVAKSLLFIDNLDYLIDKGDIPSTVDKICSRLKADLNKYSSVSGSKYCHFHRKERFPIYDKYSNIGLSYIFNKEIKISKEGYSSGSFCNNDYKIFAENIFQLIEKVSSILENRNESLWLKDIDYYLWLLGHCITYENYKNQGKDPKYLEIGKDLKTLLIKENKLFSRIKPE